MKLLVTLAALFCATALTAEPYDLQHYRFGTSFTQETLDIDHLTDECEYVVRYQNALTIVGTTSRVQFETLNVLISRGVSAEPDHIYISTETGFHYEESVAESGAVEVCIPYPLIG
jgi:hypothetical protein